jgi:CheY-like chemotaxis protein
MTATIKHFPGEAVPAPAPVPTILVVDDNPTNLKLASDVLEYAGYRVLKAVDAEEAQVVLGRSQPNLIFMDLALPGMDGLTLTRKLKAAPSTKHIRIIALTAFAMKGDEEKAREAGCDGYIAKPIDTRNFPAQAAEFLQGRTNLTTVPLG